jgi:glutamine cyclotransferase
MRERAVRVLSLVILAAATPLGACRGNAAPSAGEQPAATSAIDAPPRAAPPTAPERLTVRVVARYPHDRDAFTQGLLWHAGKLYESTGLYARSSLRRVDLATGTVEAQASLSPQLFGEGIALAGDRLVQLTWREGRALRWKATTLTPDGEWLYDGEGWGLAFDGRRFVQSDGSTRLTFRDPATFDVTGTIEVTDGTHPIGLLNELELVDGALYANVWTTDEIVRIDPQSGVVTARIDASPLRDELRQQGIVDDAVLNGIAWRPETKTFLLTGKLWPTLFEVQLVPAGG